MGRAGRPQRVGVVRAGQDTGDQPAPARTPLSMS